MKFHAIRMVGPFNCQTLTAAPTFSADRDTGRLIYLTNGDLMYGNATQWVSISNLSAGHTHAVVTTSTDGFMSYGDKIKLDSLTNGLVTNLHTHALVTHIIDGFMSHQDKIKLDELGSATGTGWPFVLTDIRISSDCAVPVGKNAISGGPVTVDPGVIVTVDPGSTWTVV